MSQKTRGLQSATVIYFNGKKGRARVVSTGQEIWIETDAWGEVEEGIITDKPYPHTRPLAQGTQIQFMMGKASKAKVWCLKSSMDHSLQQQPHREESPAPRSHQPYRQTRHAFA